MKKAAIDGSKVDVDQVAEALLDAFDSLNAEDKAEVARILEATKEKEEAE